MYSFSGFDSTALAIKTFLNYLKTEEDFYDIRFKRIGSSTCSFQFKWVAFDDDSSVTAVIDRGEGILSIDVDDADISCSDEDNGYLTLLTYINYRHCQGMRDANRDPAITFYLGGDYHLHALIRERIRDNLLTRDRLEDIFFRTEFLLEHWNREFSDAAAGDLPVMVDLQLEKERRQRYMRDMGNYRRDEDEPEEPNTLKGPEREFPEPFFDLEDEDGELPL